MDKNCIISFANQKGYYIDGLARLSHSLRNNSSGIEFISFIGEDSLGCELHTQNPYAFKVAAFKKAVSQGYTNILWLDSSCFAINNIIPIFEEIEKNGFIFQDAGHLLGNWANDFTLNYFGITRDEAMEMKMIGNAGFLGLNFKNGIAVELFNKWEQSCIAGCFKGAWSNSEKTESEDVRCFGARHDMSASSAIVNQMGLFKYAHSGEEILQYAGLYDAVLNDTIIFKAQGI